MRIHLATLAALACCLAAPTTTRASILIDFNDLVHGEIVNTQYSGSGLTISAINPNGPDIAAAFDSEQYSWRDPDLVGPPAGTWATGNLAPGTRLGRLLIIAENSRDRNNDGILDYPDDEGARPAGSIFMDFGVFIDEIGFDLVDVEGPEEYGAHSGYTAIFHNGTETASIGFGDFVDMNSVFYDSTVEFGDNSANRIAPITAEMLGISSFNRVEFNFGGSGAIDNIRYSIYTPPEDPPMHTPEPASVLIWSCLLGIGGYRATRKRRQQ